MLFKFIWTLHIPTLSYSIHSKHLVTEWKNHHTNQHPKLIHFVALNHTQVFLGLCFTKRLQLPTWRYTNVFHRCKNLENRMPHKGKNLEIILCTIATKRSMSLATIATANHPIRKPYFNDMQACCAGCVTSPEPSQVRQLTHNFSALTMKSLTLPDRQGRQWRSTKATQNAEGQIRMQLRNQSNQQTRMQTWNDSFFQTNHVAAAAMPQPMQAAAAATASEGGKNPSAPTLLYNTLLQLFSTTSSPTLLYSPLPQHFLPTLLYKTLLQRFSTALVSETSLQHFSTTLFGDICPALLYNALLQLFSTTLLYKISLQHCSATFVQDFSATPFSNSSLQHSSPTLLYNACCNSSLQHLLQLFSATRFPNASCSMLLYKTLPQHFSTAPFSDTPLQPRLQHFSTTLFSNSSLQHSSPTLLAKASLQNSSTTLLCASIMCARSTTVIILVAQHMSPTHRSCVRPIIGPWSAHSTPAHFQNT